MYSRVRQPYKKKTASKGGALIFGMGLGALMATITLVVGITIPNINNRLQYLPYYARTYYRKLVPHPEYLPTPAPTVSAGVTTGSNEPIKFDLPPIAEPSASEAIPAAVRIDGDTVSPADAAPTGPQNDNALPAPEEAGIILQTAGDRVQLTGLTHQWQTWNNCGPATITTNMSYFGRAETQKEAAQFLKPNQDDKNVSPHELAAYARSVGLGAIVRQGGSIEQLKLFLRNNLPILTETWLVHDGDGLGHYRLITGFDDAAGQFTTMDSLNGANYGVTYNQFDSDWRVFNRLYVVVFPPEQAELVTAIVGENIDDTTMYKELVRQAQSDIEADPNDAIAYFNLGDSLTRLGRYPEAVQAFDQARTLGLHWRRLWYQFTPYEAYYAAGRFQDVLDLAEATLAGTGGLEEAYYFQGLALLAVGQPGAQEAFEAALEYNPNFTLAQDALNMLAAN